MQVKNQDYYGINVLFDKLKKILNDEFLLSNLIGTEFEL